MYGSRQLELPVAIRPAMRMTGPARARERAAAAPRSLVSSAQSAAAKGHMGLVLPKAGAPHYLRPSHVPLPPPTTLKAGQMAHTVMYARCWLHRGYYPVSRQTGKR